MDFGSGGSVRRYVLTNYLGGTIPVYAGAGIHPGAHWGISELRNWGIAESGNRECKAMSLRVRVVGRAEKADCRIRGG